jgi:hypothetical protein
MVEFLNNWNHMEDLGKKREDAGKSVTDACRTTADAGMKATTEIAAETMDLLGTAVVGYDFRSVGCSCIRHLDRLFYHPQHHGSHQTYH